MEYATWSIFLFLFYLVFLRIGFSKEKCKYLLSAKTYIAFAWQGRDTVCCM